jgi:4-hydroxybutyryl-CoA dehydratase/vinylacetyl-CoA-Delta-isomerase
MMDKPIESGEEYIESLRNRDLKIYLFGELPSINAMAKTYDLANSEENLGTVHSSLSDQKINRFLHIAEKSSDLVMQNKMQRRLGQLTGTCFQRCVGMDAINALHSVTYDTDKQHNTNYHQKFLTWLKEMQNNNYVLGGAMTDVKGDRSKKPYEQEDPDMFVHVVKRDDKGVYITGAKAHQTGAVNSHWLIIMPTMRLTEQDKDYAIVGAIPVDAPGITYIYGRQSNDLRHLEGFPIDTGNFFFSGQEALVIFENVFIPNDLIFMNGEYEFASPLVDRFTNYHRRSYVCKSGVSDVLIGAAATIADFNGVPNVSHIKDKLVEMVHLNETIYATGIASSYQSYQLPSGVWMNDDILANVCKQNVTRFPYELGRLAQDIAGGLMVTLPSAKDMKHEKVGPLLDKYLKGKSDISTKDRVRILRLIENMTLGRNAVGYLTESMHGAGSPQAQRINIYRQMQIEFKKNLAKYLAGMDINEEELSKFEGFYQRVFK